MMRPAAILFTRELRQVTKGADRRDRRAQYVAPLRIHRQRNRQRLHLGVLTGDQIIELQVGDLASQLFQEIVLRFVCFLGEIDELALDGCAMDVQDQGTTPHGNARAQELSQDGVNPSLALTKIQRSGGVGEFFSTFCALEALDEAGLAATIEVAIFSDKSFAAKG